MNCHVLCKAAYSDVLGLVGLTELNHGRALQVLRALIEGLGSVTSGILGMEARCQPTFLQNYALHIMQHINYRHRTVEEMFIDPHR